MKLTRYFRRSLRYLKPYWKLAVCSVLLLLLSVLVALLIPWPLKFIIDNVLQTAPLPPIAQFLLHDMVDDRTRMLITFVVIGFGLVLVQNVLTVLASYVN